MARHLLRLLRHDLMRLSRQDYVRFEAALGPLYGATSLRVLQHRMMQTAATLVDNLWVSYNEADSLDAGHGVSLASPDAPADLARFYPVLHTLWHEHPSVHPRRWRTSAAARTFGDCLPRPRVERLALYNEYYRQVGAADQLVTMVGGDGPLRCISINRARSNFSTRDRTIMNLLQPHLQRVYRNLTLLDRFATGLPMLIVDAIGRIEFISDPAARWLRQAFGPLGLDGTAAPEPLRQWLRAQAPCPGRFFESLHARAGDRLLAFRLVSLDTGRATVVIESTCVEQPHTGWSRLTPREREVLAWVVDGKSNPEIALILVMSRRTVEKHMESILAKLALESRAQAMRVALERGLTPASIGSGA